VLATPVDDYLARQRDLTAVERFAQRHADLETPLQADVYRDLIPLSTPSPGQQYAFEVDLDLCTGCKACVTACNSLNGLDPDESFRSVGALLTDTALGPHVQTITTACHHCEDPACLNGCPVDAYEKDPVTGIVSHLDDQCIGCHYCELTCPYEVPRFNQRLGVVRKCDMCRDRLGAGEAPACVGACPTRAISVTLVETGAPAGERLVPGAPPSRLTKPTTVYRSSVPLAGPSVAADHRSLRPSHGHPSLVAMLVLTQISVGTLLVDLLTGGSLTAPGRTSAAVTALLLGLMALGASFGHLGRPRYAYRAVRGLRHSWLSREIVAFGVFAGAAMATASATVVDHPWLTAGVVGLLRWSTAGAGVAGVVCSVMIYAVTGRRWWRLSATAARFAATTVTTGMATVLAVGGPGHLVGPLVVLMAVELAVEGVTVLAAGPPDTDIARSRQLLRGPLRSPLLWRLGLGTAAMAMLVGGLPLVAWALVVASALVARWLFFVAEAWAPMPGLLR
jgi:Fe-S-cluster-containing dehydrogenase component/DMSO reductase anchor subunit